MLICVPVCARDLRGLRESAKQAAEIADLIEARLDCLEKRDIEAAARAMLSTGLALVLTLRPREQGGNSEIDFSSRRAFWSRREIWQSDAALVDLELDLALAFTSPALSGDEIPDWKRVICSHHDFSGVPDDLAELYGRMSKTPARVLKIAVLARDATDCLAVFDLLDRARCDEREIIAVAMGPAGILTRILGTSRGSFLTYGSLDGGVRTAPGQLSATELRRLYRIDTIDEATVITGLIGSPVSHSVSPHMHNAAFERRGLNAVYLPIEVHEVESFLKRMAHPRTREMRWNLRGLSVTAPHKRAVGPHLDWIEPAAETIGAVNTIVLQGDEMHGYNTDAAAFLVPLERKFGALRGARCAVVGAGGAARAAAFALRNSAASVTIVARDPQAAARFAEDFEVDYIPLDNGRFSGFDIVVNATPVGTRGAAEDQTPISSEQMHGVRLAYDMVYNPIETRFLQEARRAGCDTIGGLEMLVEQAAAQFRLWSFGEAPVELMREAAFRAIPGKHDI